MIIVRLIGGLGNQLFQYALGRSVALKHNTSLKLDITPFDNYKLHAYSLRHFGIAAGIATRAEMALFTDWRSFLPRARRKLHKLMGDPYVSFEEKRWFDFDPEVFNQGRHVYFQGFWQNEQYFTEIESPLRSDLQVKTIPDQLNAEYASRIRMATSVGLHIRRADYASEARTNMVHGLCSLEYYQTAIRQLAKSVANPHFFVFSDDPQWAEENLKAGYPTAFVTHNRADRNYEDLRLMSLCKHCIIANSTFSWWAAWLSNYPGKMVFAPKRWFAEDGHDTRGLIPKGWHTI